jgi:hypothetical protein
MENQKIAQLMNRKMFILKRLLHHKIIANPMTQIGTTKTHSKIRL